jgi:hypothetical protein
MSMPDGSKRSVCAAGHDTIEVLQPDGSHAISCPVCYAARHAAHELTNNVYGDFGREAGMSAKINPSTDTAMLNVHGKQQARLLFPKRKTVTSAAKTAELRRAMAAAIGPNLALRPAAIATIARMARECPKDFQGLRVDCILQARNILLWIDVGIVHTTAKSSVQQMLKFVRRLYAAELAAAGNFAMNVLSGHVSPPVLQYGRHKDVHYKPMLDAAVVQVKQGKRAIAPVFAACIFSHLGEMSPTTIKTIEAITDVFRTTSASKYFEDGISLKRRTADFRMRFKDALMVANANGFGTTLSAAGQVRAGMRPVSAFDHGGLPSWEVDPVHVI